MLNENKIIEILSEIERVNEEEIIFEINALKNVLSGGYSLSARIAIIKDKGDILENLYAENRRIRRFKEKLFENSDFMALIKECLLN